MIRLDWNDSRPERWEADQRRYRVHLARISRRLPISLRTFVDGFTLHDDHFAGSLVIPDAPHGRDVIVSGYLYRTGVVGAAALLTLHFVGVRGVVPPLPLGRDILYFDVELRPADSFRLSFALDGKRRWSVTFRDFDYHVYEYVQKA